MSETMPISSLVQYGLLGLVLGWFMSVTKKELQKLADAINSNTLAVNKLVENIRGVKTI